MDSIIGMYLLYYIRKIKGQTGDPEWMRSTQLHSDKNFDNLGSYNNFGWRISFDKFPYLYYSTTYLYKLE